MCLRKYRPMDEFELKLFLIVIVPLFLWAFCYQVYLRTRDQCVADVEKISGGDALKRLCNEPLERMIGDLFR